MDILTVAQLSEDVGSSSKDVFLFLTLLENVHKDYANEHRKVTIMKWKGEGCFLQKFVPWMILDFWRLICKLKKKSFYNVWRCKGVFPWSRSALDLKNYLNAEFRCCRRNKHNKAGRQEGFCLHKHFSFSLGGQLFKRVTARLGKCLHINEGWTNPGKQKYRRGSDKAHDLRSPA